MRRQHPFNRHPAGGYAGLANLAASQRRGSMSPLRASNNAADEASEEAASLRAAIQLFQSTMKGFKQKRDKTPTATQESKPAHSAAAPMPATTIGKLLDKKGGVTLAEVQAVTSLLQSPLVAMPQIGAENEAAVCSRVHDFIIFAYHVALNASSCFDSSTNVTELNGFTRQIAALIDSVRSCLDHFAARLESTQGEQKHQRDAICVDISLYSRVLTTFVSKNKKKVEGYEHLASDEIGMRQRLVKLAGDEEAEKFLAEALKAQNDQEQVPGQEAAANDAVMREEKDGKPASEGASLDDLDSVLNFETKAFTELFSSMNDVLALEEQQSPAVDEATPALLQESSGAVQQQFEKDQRLNQEFLAKSFVAVSASIVRFVNALIGPSSGIGVSASVNQLHAFTQLKFAQDIGLLFETMQEIDASQADALRTQTLTKIVEQVDMNIAAMISSCDVMDSSPKLENKKLNAITDAEISLVRLGGLADALHSLKQPQILIEKVIGAELLKRLAAWIPKKGCCSPERVESIAQALVMLSEPLQKLVRQQSASKQKQRYDLLNLVLSLTTLLKKVDARRVPQKQSPSKSIVTRSQTQQQKKEKEKKPPVKNRDDIRKFLRAKRSQLAQKAANNNGSAEQSDVIVVAAGQDAVSQTADQEMKEQEQPDATDVPAQQEEEEEKKGEDSDADKDVASKSQDNEEESSYDEQISEKLVIACQPEFTNTVKTVDLLLVLVAKQVTSGASLDISELSKDSFDLLIDLVRKTSSILYEGIFQLLCRSSLGFSPSLKAMVEAKLCALDSESYASSRTLTTFTCKLLLKLPFSEESVETLVRGAMKYSIDNFTRDQGCFGPLNLYMLMLTSLCLNDSQTSGWRQRIFTELLMERHRQALDSEAAKKSVILPSMKRLWHLMALLMLDDGAAKLQKKAVFTFLTKSESAATLNSLLVNPFNWKINQGLGTLSVQFSAKQLMKFVQDIYSLRNVFGFDSIEEPLEVPCAIIGAQLSNIGLEAFQNFETATPEDASQLSLLRNLFDFNTILHNGNKFTKEGLQATNVQSLDRLRQSLTSALKLIMADETVSEQELALYEQCLRNDNCKPLVSLASLKQNSQLAQAFDQVISKDALPFPVQSIGSGVQDPVKEPINGMYVSKHLFSHIKTLFQTGMSEISLTDLLLIQSHYSVQMICSAQESLLNQKFQLAESLQEGREKVINHYLMIIGQSVELLEAYSSAGNAELKAEEIKSNVLERILKAEHFADTHLTHFIEMLLKKASGLTDESNEGSQAQQQQAQEDLSRLFRTILRKELIWKTLPQQSASQVIKTEQLLQKSDEAESMVETNQTLTKFFIAISRATQNQDAESKKKFVASLWQSLSQLGDNLASYLCETLESNHMMNDLQIFLFKCFRESDFEDQLSELVYEAIETTCGIKTSMQGYLSSAFVLNSMNLANSWSINFLIRQGLMVQSNDGDENKMTPRSIKSAGGSSSQEANAKSEERFVQFIKEVLMQQVFQNEDARLLVLDTLCILCQDLRSQVSPDEKGENNFESLVSHCRQQYLDFKEKVEARRQTEDKEAEDEMLEHESHSVLSSGQKNAQQKAEKKQKQALLEGFRREKFDNSDGYLKYMFKPEEKCTFIRTGKKFEEQHWYYCYTCGLTGNTGVCAVCVRVCHAGHHVIYCKKSTFFCDCSQDGKECGFEAQIKQQQSNRPSDRGPDSRGLFNFSQPGGPEGFGEVHPGLFARDGSGFGGRQPDFLAGGVENPFGDNGLFGGRPDRQPKPNRPRVQQRIGRPENVNASVFGGRSSYRPDINEPFVPAFSHALGSSSRLPPGQQRANDRENAAGDRAVAVGGGLFGQSAMQSIFGAPPIPSRRQEQSNSSKPPGQQAAPASLQHAGASFANIMRRFDRIVNDESENSNLDGGDRENEAMDVHARELDLARRQIERSLARSGRAGLSDANFLSGSLRLGSVLDRPIFEPVASDSGQEEIEALDDINYAAIQQEMIEAGYSQSEIRASLQNRLERQNKLELGANEESSSNSMQSQSNEILIKSQSGQQPDFEMSQVSSLSNDTWGGISDAESLHSGHFRQKAPLTAIEKQSQRFSALKTVLVDQQGLVESILAQVYSNLDEFKAGSDGRMEVDSGLIATKQSSAVDLPLSDWQPKIEFSNDYVHQRHQQKAGTFKLQISDRSTKNFVQENMRRRKCVTTTDQGLVCLLQDDQVVFYGANNLLDPAILQRTSDKSQLYKGQPKPVGRGGNQPSVTSVSTFKPSFVPVAALFNPAYNSYCAVWGINDLTVLTVCPKEGKVKSDLTVNLMLAAFGEQLSILDVKWIPSARSILGVGSQIFVRIYDLSKDNFSPLYNIQLTAGQMTDFTFTKPLNTNCLETGQIQTRILVTSKTDCDKGGCSDCHPGQLFSQELELVNDDSEVGSNKVGKMQIDEKVQNSEVFLTHQIAIPAAPTTTDATHKITNDTDCLPTITSVCYLPTHSLLALSFKSGQTMIGRLDTRSFELSHCSVIPVMKSLKQPDAQFLTHNGHSFSQFSELNFMDGNGSSTAASKSLFIMANYSKQGGAVPVIMELTAGKIKVNIVREKQVNLQNKVTPSHGFALVKPSFTKIWRKAPRLMTFDEAGQAFVYKIEKLDASTEERKESTKLKELGAFKRIIKTDLPKKVIMPANFFEKQKSIFLEPSLYKQMSVSGSFAKMLKSRIHRLFDAKLEECFTDDRESETKVILSLNAQKSQNSIIGLRIKVGASRRQGEIKIKVMEREPITVPQGDNFWFDLALSDVEVIYGAQNQIELQLSTTHLKSCPIRLYKVEVFVATIQDFQLAEKQSRHMRELHKQMQAEKSEKKSANAEAAIQRELLQTNHLPYISWSDKYKAVANGQQLHMNGGQLGIKLSILQQFLLSNVPNDNADLMQTLETLRQKLTDAYHVIIAQGLDSAEAEVDAAEPYLHASIKRTLKIVLSMLKSETQLGEPLNFKTIKDKHTIDAIWSRYTGAHSNDEVPAALVKKHLRALGHIRSKRSQQYFKLVEGRRELVDKITQAYIGATQSDKARSSSSSDSNEPNLQQEARDLVNLIFADFQMQVNAKPEIKEGLKGNDLKTLIEEQVMNDTNLAQSLEPIARLLSIKNDQVAKHVIKAIQRCIFQFQVAMARSYKNNQIVKFKYWNETTGQVEETQVLIIDVIPHLLHQLLINTIPRHRERAQLAFKVVLGALQAYVQQSTLLGLPVEFVFTPLKLFIERVLCEAQVSEPSYQYTFACLTLVNTVLVTEAQRKILTMNKAQLKPNGGGLFAVPDSEFNASSISPLTRDQRGKFIEYLASANGLGERLLTWLSQALEQLNAAYQAGRCSLRVKIENQVKTGAQDHLTGDNQQGAGANLLRPVVNHQALWRWSPLLPNSDEIFELLDRKIPASILILCQLVSIDLKFQQTSQVAFKKLLRAIVQLSHTLPSSQIFSLLGQRTLQTLTSEQATTFKNQTLLREFVVDLKQVCTSQLGFDLQQAESRPEDNNDDSETADQQKNSNIEMSYNMQFQFQEMLQQGAKLAMETPNDWRELIDQSSGGKGEIIRLLVRLLDHVSGPSAILCLTLATLTLPESTTTTSSSDKNMRQNQPLDGQTLFRMVQAQLKRTQTTTEEKMAVDETSSLQATKPIKLDLRKLVDIYLLGKSDRKMRIQTAQLLKALYDARATTFSDLLPIFARKFATLASAGVNSSEFLCIFGYLCQRELVETSVTSLTSEQVTQIVSFISGQIQMCNRQLTSHPNLELYATIQKVCSSGQLGSPGAKMHHPFSQELMMGDFARPEVYGAPSLTISSFGKDQTSQQQQQSYILELDPCSKCFQTQTKPYRGASLKDIQSESKFTDSTSIYRLKSACELKSLSFNVQEAKGYKAVTKVTLYVNSIQEGVDLAEMKTNWQLWQKVCDLNVDLAQKSRFEATLPLPVTATNILIEYHSVNLSKPVEFSGKGKGGGPPSSKYFGSYGAPDPNRALSSEPVDLGAASSMTEGLDPVLQLLPKEVTSKLSMAQLKQNQAQGSLQPHNISMSCPRCGTHVNNSHGNCNGCGENAMQCLNCRNINYEKIDPYQCKECGVSRYCKSEISFNLREGVAVQLIETEDAKKHAEGQVEKLLQKAQSSYQALMKHRSTIQILACQINEGNESASPKHLQQVYGGECQTHYSTMMKALSGIKQLRIEIDKFQRAARSVSAVKAVAVTTAVADAGIVRLDECATDGIRQNCFGCIQEYLQALLNFIQMTAGQSEQIRTYFAKKDMARQLYQESLRMFSQSIYLPARQAICALVAKTDDDAQLAQLLAKIEHDLHTRHLEVPAHLLFQNLHQEAQLLIELFDLYSDDKQVQASFWRTLFQSLTDAKGSSAIAEAVTAPILKKIDRIIATDLQKKPKQEQDNEDKSSGPVILISTSLAANSKQEEVKGESAMLQLLMDYLSTQDKSQFTFVEGDVKTKPPTQHCWLVQSLLLASSQSARQHSVAILKRMLTEKVLRPHVTEVLLGSLDQSLEITPLSGEEYFTLLTGLLTGQIEQQQSQELPRQLRLGSTNPQLGVPAETDKQQKINTTSTTKKPAVELNEDTKRHFRQVFDRIDGELIKLFELENEKKVLGPDGFMPQLSAGQSLSRLVKIVALMMNDQPALTAIVQQQVRVVLKTLLKLKKLRLVKNKQLANCEEQINGIFKRLHSENAVDKSNFIKECLGLIASGDCDLQEARYLFEDICKMIVPAKIEHEYFLQLQKARSNEEFIPGRIVGNPHSSKSFGGKTMGDVRLKICRDCDIGEPEMLELLVAGKIVTMGLPISAVYEQVWWPAQYKAKHPDSYEVPSIDQGMQEDPSLINPMVVIFRLAGMDGEATEDRVESLQTDQEPSSEKELQKKYGLASVIGENLDGDQSGNEVTGVAVLLKTLAAIGQVQENKDLASWLVQLMNISIKLKANRLEFLRHPKAVAIIAKKLFQSVGMHSKFDGRNEQSLFDLILNILEVLISEQMVNAVSSQSEAQQHQQQQSSMAQAAASNTETVTHVQIFLSLIADACKEMIEAMTPLDQASKKIKAISKVLPQLIGENDQEALSILVQLVQEHLTVEKVHLTLPPSQNASISADSFSSRFYIERIIDIVESIPVHKNFIKDSLCEMPQFAALFNFMINESTQFKEPTTDRPQDLTQNVLMLRIVKAMVQNHAKSQQLLARYNLVEKLYTLSLQKFKPMQLVLLAEDCVKLLTNELASSEVRSGLKTIIDQKKKEQTVRAKKAKMAAQKRLQKKGAANKFLSMMNAVQEEKGPKCVSCEDGYMAKPTEIMGVYVFSKRNAFRENPAQSPSHGYTTVTHSNYIHLVCHAEVARVDRERQQPIREWDGAKTRNHHTLCNNLFPVFGGTFPTSSYSGIVDKYFSTQAKQVGGSDSNRAKVLCHDLKSLLKRFACNESFSRDSKGGGPEHNMQFVPSMTSMILYCLSAKNNSHAKLNFLKAGDESGFIYVQEKKLAEFLQLSTQQRQTFLARLAEEEAEAELQEEEEKKSEQSEEEDKRMEEDEDDGEEGESELDSHSEDFAQFRQPAAHQRKGDRGAPEEDPRVDQVFYFMSQALIFSRIANWETTKVNLITRALCVVAATRNQPQSSAARLRMMEAEALEEDGVYLGRGRARSLSNASFALSENLTEILGRLRPFFLMLSLVDMIKTTWNQRVPDGDVSQRIDAYHATLMSEYLTKDNLVPVIEDCNAFFKAFDEKMARVESVESFLNQLNLTEKITAEFTTIEKFVCSHFSTSSIE